MATVGRTKPPSGGFFFMVGLNFVAWYGENGHIS